MCFGPFSEETVEFCHIPTTPLFLAGVAEVSLPRRSSRVDVFSRFFSAVSLGWVAYRFWGGMPADAQGALWWWACKAVLRFLSDDRHE